MPEKVAHGHVRGICQAWGILYLGAGWIPKAPSFHLRRQLANQGIIVLSFFSVFSLRYLVKSYGNPDADDVESFINLSQVLTLFTLRKN